MPHELFKNGFALLIGVGGDLPATVTDAEKLHATLTDPERAGYPTGQTHLLTGAAAGRGEVLAGLDQLYEQVRGVGTHEATLLVYYSGHGGYDTTDPARPFYLLTHGYDPGDYAGTCLSGADFSGKLRRLAEVSRKLVVILDACHAGQVKDTGRNDLDYDANRIVEGLDQGSGQVVLASSQSAQKSYLGPNGLSLFTECLIEALGGKNTEKEDPFVSFTEVWEYLGKEVTRRAQELYDQPQEPVINAREMTNFFLARNRVEAIAAIPKVFVMNAPTDEPFAEALRRQMATLARLGVITHWDPGQMVAGLSIRQTLQQELGEAQIVVPLVSADYLNDDRCREIQEQAHRQGKRILPVIVRHCLYDFDPLLADLPKEPLFQGTVKPVKGWEDQDQALMNVAKRIVQIAKAL